MLDLAFPVWRGLRRSSPFVVSVWLAFQALFFGGCSGSRTNPAACLPSPSPELVLPPATGGTTHSTQVVGAGGSAWEAVSGTEEPEIEDDNSPVTGPSFDAPVPAPVASPHSPALLRKGASCWIYDDSIPGPPVVVYLNVGTVVVYHGKCWAAHFDVASTAARPFHAPEFGSTAMHCPDVEGQRNNAFPVQALLQ